MRVSQVYRWQIPMDAGVVLRERRLKTATGCSSACRREREGWGEISPLPGFSVETLEEAQMALLAWAQARRDGVEPPLPAQPSVAFGISCAQAGLSGGLPQAADYRAAPLCSGDRMSYSPDWRRCPARRSLRSKLASGRRSATKWWSICCWRRSPTCSCGSMPTRSDAAQSAVRQIR